MGGTVLGFVCEEEFLVWYVRKSSWFDLGEVFLVCRVGRVYGL